VQNSNRTQTGVGAAEGCDLLILKAEDQKIAAFGSSYSECVHILETGPLAGEGERRSSGLTVQAGSSFFPQFLHPRPRGSGQC
jgi:hypothetical protein